MVYISRKEQFNAAHRLFRPDFTDEKNLEVFGKCSNPNWHGHNYTLFVTVAGSADPGTGFVMNLKTLSSIINEYVIEKVDHKNINLEVKFMHGQLASTENLAIGIWDQLEKPISLHGGKLYKISLHETDNNYVEYYGDKRSNETDGNCFINK
jgi:6-pyruvoyltetrahydropterin/6-carboxytetrahydropterin synthase